MSDLDQSLADARPELVVMTLLQHSLGAARHALLTAHPELHDENLDAGDVDDPTHLALLIALHLGDLNDVLRQYRTAVESEWRSYDGDIPF
jgi:hypothetical protein